MENSFYKVMKAFALQSAFLLICLLATAQVEPPIAVGEWRSHFFSETISSLTLGDEDEVYAGGEFALFEYHDDVRSLVARDKISGLSGSEITAVYYNPDLQKLYVIYEDADIDILEGDAITNFPFIKTSSVSGNKTVNEITRDGDFLYLSSGIGIIVLDMVNEEIKETYTIIPVGEPSTYSTALTADSIYVSTASGIYAGAKSSNLSNFNNWKQVDSIICQKIVNYQGDLLLLSSEDMYRRTQGQNELIFSSDSSFVIMDADIYGDDIYFVTNNPSEGKLYILKNGTQAEQILTDRIILNPRAIEINEAGVIFIADFWQGLLRVEGDKLTNYVPPGPSSNQFYDIYFADHKMYCPSGAVDLAYNGRGLIDGLKIYDQGWWSDVNGYDHPKLADFRDVMTVARDANTESIYAGSWGAGLMELHPDGSIDTFRTGYFDLVNGNSARITSMVMDPFQNLWMTNFGPNVKALICKKSDNSFVTFDYNQGAGIGPMAIDEAGQLWMIEVASGRLYCYDPAGTIDDPNDDRQSSAVAGLSGAARSLHITEDGELWIGTDNGISIIHCPESFLDNNCDVELRVVNYDGIINGYLFHDEIVNTITTDGANRKWVGTENGAWLISEDAKSVVHAFNTTNSPLPSNKVYNIGVNPDNGEVFFITEKGLVSYRSDATEGVDVDKQELLVFPNPIEPGYEGNIAIRGVSTDARVKITDAKGQLVFQTTAYGGQANWNGYTYTGKKAQSGVYYVFAMSKDGSLTSSTKFVIIN